MMKKIRVVVNLNYDETADPANLTSAAVSLIQQAFANVPGASLVGIVEIANEEVLV